MQLANKETKVTALMTAESIIVGFLLAYTSLINERVVALKSLSPPQSVFTTVLAGLLIYGLVLTAFRSLLLLFESIRIRDSCESNYNAGYDLFLLVILGSGLYVLMNAFSILHYATTNCIVTPPDEYLFYKIAALFFAAWVVVLVFFVPLRISPYARCVRSNLGTWRYGAVLVLSVVDGTLLASIGSKALSAGNCLVDSYLLKWPGCLLPTMFAVLTICAIWMCMMPESEGGEGGTCS